MYDYDVTYGNLDLSLLDDEELHNFANKLVCHFLMGMYLLGFSQNTGGAHRIFDLDNYEVSELSHISVGLLEGFTKTGRKRYQDQVDTLLFKVSLFEGDTMSVKVQIQQSIAKEMRVAIRNTMDRRGGA